MNWFESEAAFNLLPYLLAAMVVLLAVRTVFGARLIILRDRLRRLEAQE